jgi:hypothetical protein
LSRPFGHIKKVGLLSFAIRGTTFHQSTETNTSTSTSTSGGVATTTTTTRTKTTTLEFPQQPNEVWDKLLEQLYPEFMAVVESEFNASSLAPEVITKAPSYKSITAFAKDDVNTKVEFTRSFRDTKVVSAFMPIADGYGVNGVNERILKETGADALLTLTLDLQISEETGKSETMLMVPKFAFEITGKANGFLSNTKYITGTIESKTGVSFTKDITPAQLESIIRKSDLLAIFKKSLQEIKDQEKSNGDYDIVWNLQQ